MYTKFKTEIIIFIIIVAIMSLIIGVVFKAGDIRPTVPALKNGSSSEPVNKNVSMTSDYTVLVSMGQNVCEGCHLSGKPFIPQAYNISQHVKGGAYCLICHIFSHEKHPMNDNVTCSKCHGEGPAPNIPRPKNGNISCNNCHGYPDPLTPSGGNLVVIHRQRNVDCIRCHVNTCTACHQTIPDNDKWKKRLSHFDIIMATYSKK